MTNEERGMLAEIKKAAETGLSCISCGNDCISRLWQIVGLCDAALAAPPRNCDVGSPEEQERRYRAFCDAFSINALPMDSEEDIESDRSSCCSKCPLGATGGYCAFAWAQMPYTAEEGGECNATLDLYCPTCRKVTRHKAFPNDMVPMPHGLREWRLYCDCGTSYTCAAGMKYDDAVKSALLDAYEASKMFWTDEEGGEE